jgi:hypothetical protein
MAGLIRPPIKIMTTAVIVRNATVMKRYQIGAKPVGELQNERVD